MKAWFNVQREGYYPSATKQTERRTHIAKLRKKQNPIPMYTKDVHLTFPNENGDFGFDFFEGDLVEPYGKGIITDVVFRMTHQEKKRTHEVLFPDGNGIQLFFISKNRWGYDVGWFPFHAPETGYYPTLEEATGTLKEHFENELRCEVSKICELPGYWYWDCKVPSYEMRTYPWNTIVNYFIKIRVTGNDQGCYGIIPCEIRFDYFSNVSRVKFTYYLNPDRSTNLEFSGENLLKDSRKK